MWHTNRYLLKYISVSSRCLKCFLIELFHNVNNYLGEGTEGEIELDYDLDYQVDDQDITSHHSDVGDQGVQEDVNEEKNEVILYNVTSEEALKFFLS